MAKVKKNNTFIFFIKGDRRLKPVLALVAAVAITGVGVYYYMGGSFAATTPLNLPIPTSCQIQVLTYTDYRHYSTGYCVKQAQMALNWACPLRDYIPVSGNYDFITYNRVKQFQYRVGLVHDGKVGPLTWGSLNKYWMFYKPHGLTSCSGVYL